MQPIDLLLLAAIPVAMWLLFIRPAKSRRDAQAALVASLTPGDRIMTTAGVFGTVVTVASDVISVRIAEGVVIEMVPQAVGQVLPDPGPVADQATEAAVDAPAGEFGEETGAQIEVGASEEPPVAPVIDGPALARDGDRG